MSLPAWVRAAAVGAGALSMLLPGAMSAAAAPGDLIDSTPAVVVLEVPAPGESVDWSMSVTNLTDGSLPLSLEILGADLAAQCLQRGLVDEILVYVLPLLLGDGVRFSAPGLDPVELEPLGSSRSGPVTMLRYRVRR